MSNKAWVKGQPSPNPAGRPRKKKSAPSIARMLERFCTRNLSPRKLQAMFDKLKPNEKLTFLVDVLPYCLSRKPTAHAIGVANLSDQQLDDLFNQVMSGAMTLQEGITAPLLGDIPEAEIVKDGQTREN